MLKYYLIFCSLNVNSTEFKMAGGNAGKSLGKISIDGIISEVISGTGFRSSTLAEVSLNMSNSPLSLVRRHSLRIIAWQVVEEELPHLLFLIILSKNFHFNFDIACQKLT